MTKHLALIGPTASGKSAVAQRIAESRGDCELVSLDAFQVYREMDIGTAKPTVSDRAAVAHHLVDVADPDAEWSVRLTQDAARYAIADIEARGRRAILVGGTGLYVRAVIDDLAVPGSDPAVRAALEAETATPEGLAAARNRLADLDPVAASRIEPGNRRRIVRALEAITVTGEPFSASGPGLDEYGPPAVPVVMVGIEVPAAVLALRIADRVAAMSAAGLLDEVRALVGRPGGWSRTARKAIGYAEMVDHLDGGMSLEAALDRTVVRTRQFARRQRAWFRRDPRTIWIPGDGAPATVAHEVVRVWGAAAPAGAVR
ncbi:MAG: tRNA (adenosine(37)-N6)-dimethylallyltransferase MiaA [Actinomycetota bacterium]